MTETLLHQLDQASATLQAAKSTALATWRSPCACPNPGTQLACATCPAFGALVQQVQQLLDSTLAHSTPTWLPPATPPSAAVWAQQCCELFACGYTLTEIQALTGVPQQEQVRRWLRAARLLGGAESYSAATRERCVALYQQGWPVSEIQAATGVPGDVVGDWAQQAGWRQRSPGYPAAVRQQCLELYISVGAFVPTDSGADRGGTDDGAELGAGGGGQTGKGASQWAAIALLGGSAAAVFRPAQSRANSGTGGATGAGASRYGAALASPTTAESKGKFIATIRTH